MNDIEEITHPISGGRVRVRRLKAGEVLKKTDLYKSADGSWRLTPLHGVSIIEAEHNTFIRPTESTLE